MADSGENEWRLFIQDGDKYLKTAVNASEKRSKVFTPDLLYNIVSMAIEKHVMGYLLYHNRLPDNHTLPDLMDAVPELRDADGDLCRDVIRMGHFQEICSLNTYNRRIPKEGDVREFLDIGTRIQDFVTSRLSSEKVQ
ncbi:hypothetical protein DENIS_0681 [Desulfonema ishimotonii]|uniref:HEPN domain-containing protein n=1 Tax=Desulfonema ishimotonii TaxID=45657 RepID=A0A401FS18_9BACT|nr:hypothetical protein [Desulfonema ishimotonii]GBC59740.1 hypothetical protein DENIS_0681 [Desulfonema ishimotonii]